MVLPKLSRRFCQKPQSSDRSDIHSWQASPKEGDDPPVGLNKVVPAGQHQEVVQRQHLPGDHSYATAESIAIEDYPNVGEPLYVEVTNDLSELDSCCCLQDAIIRASPLSIIQQFGEMVWVTPRQFEEAVNRLLFCRRVAVLLKPRVFAVPLYERKHNCLVSGRNRENRMQDANRQADVCLELASGRRRIPIKRLLASLHYCFYPITVRHTCALFTSQANPNGSQGALQAGPEAGV